MESNIEAIDAFRRRTIAGLEIRNDEINALEIQIKAIKTEQKKLKELDTALSQLVNAYDNQLWCEAYLLLNSDRRITEHLGSFDPLSGETIELVRIDVDSKSESIISNLVSTLPNALGQLGYQLDSDSRFPKFKIQNGLIQVGIDRKKREAKIEVRHGRPYQVSGDVIKILEAIDYESKRLNEEYDIQKLVSQIIEAIGKLRSEKNIIGDASVSLEELRLLLGEPTILKEIFALRLSDIQRKFPNVFTLEQTRDIKTGFLLPNKNYYVGRISIND
jgi:hypothetical protein